MGKVDLQALGLVVPIGFFDRYHDDGIVDSLENHTQELCDLYNAKVRCCESTTKYSGTLFVVKRTFGTRYHIYYTDHGTEEENLFVRAHEETHFLDRIGKLDLLAQKILADVGIKVDFNRVTHSDIIANIGAIHALTSGNLDLNKLVLEEDSFLLGTYTQAMEIYSGKKK